MKKKDLLIIGVAALLALTLIVLVKTKVINPSTFQPLQKQEASPAESSSLPSASPQAEIAAHSYLRIQLGSGQETFVPLDHKDTLTIDQGNGHINVVAIDIDSATMHSSTCKNQNCVSQGTVTLENKETRALLNTIVCLPNQVLLELLTDAEYKNLTEKKP